MSGPARGARTQSGSATQAQLTAAHQDLKERVDAQAMVLAGHHGQLQGLGAVVAAVQSSGSVLQSNFTAWTATAIGVAGLLIAVLVGGFVVIWGSQSSQAEKLATTSDQVTNVARDVGDLKESVNAIAARLTPPKK